ncbi:sensor histidine kinase [Bacillus wiedmannii]|uniref:sensor histidine kinase n=1 Tax=Bacillus wiedmannii TaxID=1890302 RepID=UPI000BFE9CCE|nr:HAMP domain-containing sensor histidine kinase [Bacillus wiedmannii]PHG52899.1 two-component sensor histidine kinase [Bacillus wiedmannii]
MKKKIVLQLFSLTFLLCCIIITIIFAGQFFVIQYLYIDKEKENIQKQLQQYYTSYEAHLQDEKKLQSIESTYFNQHGIMITRLDETANIKELPTGDYYILATDKSNPTKTYKIVFNNLINAKKELYSDFSIIITSLINKVKHEVSMDVVSKNKKKKKLVPISMRIKGYDGGFDSPKYEELMGSHEFLQGIVKAVHMLDYSENNPNKTLYGNESFANRILQFQADFMNNKVKFQGEKWVQNEISIDGIQYIESIKPIMKDDKEIEFIYTLTSLQPITKVTDLMNDYYVYIIVFVLILTIIICMYYSKIIIKPLLKINDATKKIIELDFREKLSIKSKNELGELSHNINQMSERIEDYINKLKEDVEKERKLEQTRKDFIAGVSHELKTPLSVMQISASMLQDGIAPEKNEYYWNILENEIEKMNILVNEMLNLAKYESGTYQILKEQVDIAGLIKGINKKLQFQIEEKNLHVSLNLENSLVMGKTNLLEQVITNLFTNAIRYTDPNQQIILNVKEEKNVVYIGIENKGAHLSSDSLDKVWNQFYRVDASRKRANGGTGLGLPIVKKILELHGANYGAKNTSDGVLFYFYLDKFEISE